MVCLKALLELLRFLYTGRTGVMEPLTALDVLFLTKGEDGSGGEGGYETPLRPLGPDLYCTVLYIIVPIIRVLCIFLSGDFV